MATTEYYYNTAEDEPCDLSPNPMLIITKAYILTIISVFGLIGNILVITTYMFYKRTKTMTDVYLLNMSVADLIFVIALPFVIYNEQNQWLMGSVACKMLMSSYSINFYSGMLLLACISVDRYIAIVRARRTYGARAYAAIPSHLICSVVWVFAAALTLPTLLYTERSEEFNLGNEPVTVSCQMSFSRNETAKVMKVLLPSLQMSFGFLMPLMVMVFCYSSIVCTLLQSQTSRRHKAVRVVLAVVVVFILCHLPYNVALLRHTTSLFQERNCEAEKLKLQVLAFSQSIAYLHCCLNPILYAFIGVKFRSHFSHAMLDLWCVSKRYICTVCSLHGTSGNCISSNRSSEDFINMSSFHPVHSSGINTSTGGQA